jgi:surface protein
MCREPINDTCLEIQEAKRQKMKAKNKGKKIKVFQRDIDLYKEDPSHLPHDKEWVLQDDVTNLSYLFQIIPYEQPNDFFNTIGVSEWNVSNVTNMVSMFSGKEAFNQPLEKWNVSNVTFFLLL